MTRKALVVGIKPYPNFRGRNQRQDLANAPLDAEAIAQILRDYGRFEVKVLPETCAEGAYQVDEKGLVKAEMLQDAIYELFVEPADGKLPQTALLFFAGHGLAIDEYGETVGYLATSETNLEQKKYGVRLDWLAKQLGKSKVSEQIVWLDCCHSGRLTQEIFEQAKPANQDDVKRFIIAACRDSETAYGVDGHGVLTHLLQKALDPEQYSVGYDINSSEIQAAVEREFNAHPKFRTYPQRPIFFSFGRPIHFWDGRGMRQPSRGMRQLSKQEYRNRQALLSQMGTEVESRLAQSLHHAVLLNLGKEQQPHQVQRPWDISVKVGEQRSFQLPSETSILEVFENPAMSGKFLILGKPGGGKTTTLLELAQALVERAETDSDAPIPVILELSEWRTVTKRKFPDVWNQEKYDPSIKEWILSQLRSKGVSQEIGDQWIREKELVLLLDGLDELPSERQAKCVRAINQFLDSEFSPLHLVVCSRKEEYEEYEEVLHLNGAISLEDLSVEQIQHYFASVNLGEFWEGIKDYAKIVNFIRQPLFLAITSIAYQQIDVEEWRNCNTEQNSIDYLLGIYRVERLSKKSNIEFKNNHSKQFDNSRNTEIIKIQNYLTHISLINTPGEELIVEELNPKNSDRILLQWYCATLLFCLPILLMLLALEKDFVGVLLVLFVFFGPFLPITKHYNLSNLEIEENINIVDIFLPLIIVMRLYFMLLSGLLSFNFFRFFRELLPISDKEYNIWDIEKKIFADYLIFPLFLTFVKFIVAAYYIVEIPLFLVFFHNNSDLEELKAVFLNWRLLFIPFWTIILMRLTFVNLLTETIKKMFVSKVILAIINIIFTSCISFIFSYTYFNILSKLNLSGSIIKEVMENTFYATLFFSIFALYFGIVWGGGAGLIKYFLLRLILGLNGYLPWNITRFLDYCTERLILQRVGNRYRFIHRLVQEHFANLEIQKE